MYFNACAHNIIAIRLILSDLILQIDANYENSSIIHHTLYHYYYRKSGNFHVEIIHVVNIQC